MKLDAHLTHAHTPQFQNKQTKCEKQNHKTIKEMSDKFDYTYIHQKTIFKK